MYHHPRHQCFHHRLTLVETLFFIFFLSARTPPPQLHVAPNIANVIPKPTILFRHGGSRIFFVSVAAEDCAATVGRRRSPSFLSSYALRPFRACSPSTLHHRQGTTLAAFALWWCVFRSSCPSTLVPRETSEKRTETLVLSRRKGHKKNKNCGYPLMNPGTVHGAA